jgi:hypothetical protein
VGRKGSTPSWPNVIATTFRLWLERRGKRMRPVGVAVAATALVAAVVTVVLVNLVPASGASGQADLLRRGADRTVRALDGPGGPTTAAVSLGRSYAAALAADLAARIAAGQQLLHNKNVRESSGARTELTAGNVDPRLLVMLAKLAGQRRVNIVTIEGAGSADAPLREAQISAATTGQLRAMLSFLRGQQAPYLPAQASLVRMTRGKYVLDIRYNPPSPIGLLSVDPSGAGPSRGR